MLNVLSRNSVGLNLGTFKVGNRPFGLAFSADSTGAYVWVTNNGSGTVTKLRASDGAHLGTIPVGDGPAGVAFDGANIWVADSGSDAVSASLSWWNQ